MRYSDFENSSSGKLVATVYGEKAFVPNPLPPDLDLSKITLELAGAMAAIGELRGACRRLRNPYILIGPLQRLEAQTSSAMEGTYTTADELVLAQAGIQKTPASEAMEVNNYIQALAGAVKELDRLPISGRLLKGAHRILLASVGRNRGQDKQPGQYARDQNMIGGTRIDRARFIPPPPPESADAMADLERYINREEKERAGALIDLALVHYQFETIHPFADGNGRLGRMLVSLMTMSEGLLEMPVLYLSPELEKRKDDYIDHMYRVSSSGEWEDWIRFFLSVLETSCRRTVDTIDRILSLQQEYHEKARAASRSNNIGSVVDMLFESPVIRPANIVERLGITDAAARNILRQLTGLEILHELRGIYPMVWVAGELLDVSRPTDG